MAADESTSTILKRFNGIKLESTEENRRAYREMLFTTPGATEFISGVILYDETIRQKTKDGVPFPAYLSQAGHDSGHQGRYRREALAGFPGETITEGLDGLRERLAEYHKLGAQIREVAGGDRHRRRHPDGYAISANAEALARYAALCQEAGIVPIVEPEVLMDGDHPIERCEEVTDRVLQTVFDHLFAARICPRGHGAQAQHGDRRQEERAEVLARASRRGDRAHAEAARAYGGARHRVFVGRPEPERGDAALELDERRGAAALAAHLQLWTGACRIRRCALGAARDAGFQAAQKQLYQRAKLNGLAAGGTYKPGMETAA